MRGVQDKQASQQENQEGPVCSLQRKFTCLSGQMVLILDTQDRFWVSLPSLCSLFSLNVRGQLQRIGRNPELVSGLSQITLSTRGGPQRINCLQAEFVSPWLTSLKQNQQERRQTFFQILEESMKILLEQKVNGDIFSNQFSLEEAALLEQFSVEEEASASTTGAVTTTLPGLGQVLLLTNYPEESAIREATLVRPDAWDKVSTRIPFYVASNKVIVSLGDPRQPLVLEDVQATLESISWSALYTARFFMWKWQVAREEGKLAEDGSIILFPEDVLEWRGISPHSREIYAGSPVRQIDGYEAKYFAEVDKDFKLLELFYLQADHRLLDRGSKRQRTLRIDSFYLRLSHIRDPLTGRQAYSGAPGGWINAWVAELESHKGLVVAELDKRIFTTLHPQNDQIAIRLALYLAEHWQQHLAADLDVMPIAMEDLLRLSLIHIDRPNLTTRFAGRVESAIASLVQEGIVGVALPQYEIVREGYWGKAWLRVPWEIYPPSDLVKSYQARKGDAQLILLAERHQAAPEPLNERKKVVKPRPKK